MHAPDWSINWRQRQQRLQPRQGSVEPHRWMDGRSDRKNYDDYFLKSVWSRKCRRSFVSFARHIKYIQVPSCGGGPLLYNWRPLLDFESIFDDGSTWLAAMDHGTDRWLVWSRCGNNIRNTMLARIIEQKLLNRRPEASSSFNAWWDVTRHAGLASRIVFACVLEEISQ